MSDADDREAAEEQVGSVADEAAKLVGALQDWAADSGFLGAEGAGSVREALKGAGEHVGHGEDCRYCPVCIAINKLRQTNPEVREHLASALTSLARAASVALRNGDGSGSADGSADAKAPTRIDLED